MAEKQAAVETRIAVDRDDDGVVAITLARPEKKNALTLSMWRALAGAVGAAGRDPATRVVVLRGAGCDFCAGADIGEFAELRGDAEAARHYEAANSATFAAIRNAPVPTIGAISGICFGGGFGIAAACDIRIGSEDALFSVPAAKLGLAYPFDAMQDIVHSAGVQMARYLAFSADRLSAPAARHAGFLLETVADRDRLQVRAGEIARNIAQNAPLSVRASKAAIRAVLSMQAADVERAQALGDLTFDSADYREGREAFRQKRRPVFRGG